MTTEQVYEKDDKGNLRAIQKYKGGAVEIKVGETLENIGDQEPYQTVQIIKKDKIPVLKKYLDEQLKTMKNNLDAAVKAMEQFKFIEAADQFSKSLGILKSILAVNGEKLDKNRIQKRLDKVNSLAGKIDQKITATANLEILKLNHDKTAIQVKYIEDNFK